MEVLQQSDVRRLALARAGLLKPQWVGLDLSTGRNDNAARAAAHRLIGHFGYLQLDAVPVAGMRSHGLVLHARMGKMPSHMAETLLQPKAHIFEYWGHECSWLPVSLYPFFEFRRRAFLTHPWWGDIVGSHPKVRDHVLQRIRAEGPLRSADFAGERRAGWWNLKIASKVATALWSSGELAIRERRGFQRTFDLTERVVPLSLREVRVDPEDALQRLLLKAFDGHGWAQTRTLAATWRFRGMATEVRAALDALLVCGTIIPCAMQLADGTRRSGYIRPDDLQLSHRLRRVRPPSGSGVLLSPFDPLLWDRKRVQDLFNFEQVLEIYKPIAQRRFGYYCLPVLAGEKLVGRVDLKANRNNGTLTLLSRHYETDRPSPKDQRAVASALQRYAQSLELELVRR